MKRDMDLIRLLLLELEGEKETDLSEYSQNEINYHKALLIEADFAEGKPHYSSRGGKDSDIIPDMVFIKRLTWKGHEFLDQARNTKIWEKAKAYVTKQGGILSIHAMKIALSVIVKDTLS